MRDVVKQDVKEAKCVAYTQPAALPAVVLVKPAQFFATVVRLEVVA